MVQALDEVGVHADLVVGTSIGALNGAVVAAGPARAAERLADIWRRMDRRTILPGGPLRRLMTLVRTRTSLYETTAIRRFVHEELGDRQIGDLAVPYQATAVDADTTELVALSDGELTSAMLASSAIPGVFPPVHRDGRHLYDGGLVTNTPVLEAIAMGAGSVVVLDCQFPDRHLRRPRNIVETVLYTMMVAQRQQVLRDLPVAAAAAPVLFLPGPGHVAVSPLDFRHSASLMSQAHLAARALLGSVEIAGAGLYRRVG